MTQFDHFPPKMDQNGELQTFDFEDLKVIDDYVDVNYVYSAQVHSSYSLFTKKLVLFILQYFKKFCIYYFTIRVEINVSNLI